MRVSTGQLQQLMMTSLQRGAADFGNISQQMSTGKKILKPSDAPLDSVILMGLNKEQAALEQYNSNASNVRTALGEAETYTQSIADTLVLMRDLVLESGNGAYSLEDRQALASELRGLQESLIDSANAKDENGDYIFSGSLVDQAPIQLVGGSYTYSGDTLQRDVNISKGVQVGANVNVETTFFSGGNNFLDEMDNFITAIETQVSLTTEVTDTLILVDDALNASTRNLTEVGARMNSVDRVKAANEEIELYSKTLELELESLDYADASMRLTQAQLALQTTQQVYTKVNQLSLFSQM